MVSLALNVFLEKGFDVFFGSGADHVVDDFAAFKDEKVGDAHDPILSGQLSVGVDVDFDDFGFAFHFGGDFLDVRADGDARSAPRGPEIDEDGDVRLKDFLFKVRSGDSEIGSHGISYVRARPDLSPYTPRSQKGVLQKGS